MVACDQPVLIAATTHSVRVGGHETHNGVMMHAEVEDQSLMEPRVHSHAVEPLHSHRLLLVTAQRHLAKATLTEEADVLQVDSPGESAQDEVRFAQSTA